MNPRAILWDNDGVLVDTEGLYFQATRDVLATVGVELTRESYRQLFLTEDRGAWHLAAARGVPADRIDGLKLERNARYTALLGAGRPLLPGVERVLGALRARYRMAVVTSSHRDHFTAIHAANRLERFVEFALCREDYARSKPDPEPYLAAAARLGLPPHTCIAVEDSVRGLTAAVAAGIPCYIIASEMTAGMDFRGAASVVDSVERLAEVLAL